MAGNGTQEYVAHDVLRAFSPDRFGARPLELAVCIDHIVASVLPETMDRPNVVYGLGRLASLRTELEDDDSVSRQLPFIAWDDINFQLTHNLVGAVPAIEEV